MYGFFTEIVWKTYRRSWGSGAVAAPAHSLTAHVHERRGRAPVAEWLAISILDSIYERARRSRSPTRWGGLTAAARATCAHLSPSAPPPGTGWYSKTKRPTKDVPRMFAPLVRSIYRRGSASPHRRPAKRPALRLFTRDTWLTRRKPTTEPRRSNWWFTIGMCQDWLALTQCFCNWLNLRMTWKCKCRKRWSEIQRNCWHTKRRRSRSVTCWICTIGKNDCSTDCRSTCKHKQWFNTGWISEAVSSSVLFITVIWLRLIYLQIGSCVICKRSPVDVARYSFLSFISVADMITAYPMWP